MALSTFGTALALYLSTVFTSAEGQLWTSSSASFLQNTMWGVVYSYSPEVFPTSVRGTAVGMASSLARVLGSTAPLATGALLQVSLQAPLYLSSAALCGAALCMILLPIETRGRAAH